MRSTAVFRAQHHVEEKQEELSEYMGSDDVDTDKFGSWPLLRPDELASLPSGVLKASLEALDLLCAQNSDGEVAQQVISQTLPPSRLPCMYIYITREFHPNVGLA